MQGAFSSLKHELGGLRTGRASGSMLDPVQVEAYGSHMPLNQLATSACGAAHDLGAGLGQVDGQGGGEGDRRFQSRLSPRPKARCCACAFPNSTRSVARNSSRSHTKYAEAAKVAARHVRRDGLDVLKKLEKNHEMSRGRPEASRRRGAEGDRRHHHRDRPVCWPPRKKEILTV